MREVSITAGPFVLRVSGVHGTADPTDKGGNMGEFIESSFRRLLVNTLITGVCSTFL